MTEEFKKVKHAMEQLLQPAPEVISASIQELPGPERYYTAECFIDGSLVMVKYNDADKDIFVEPDEYIASPNDCRNLIEIASRRSRFATTSFDDAKGYNKIKLYAYMENFNAKKFFLVSHANVLPYTRLKHCILFGKYEGKFMAPLSEDEVDFEDCIEMFQSAEEAMKAFLSIPE